MKARGRWGAAWALAALAGTGCDANTDAPDGSVCDKSCVLQWGYVVVSATPDTRASPTNNREVADLPAAVDRVQARTFRGRTVDCYSRRGFYDCHDDAGISSITITDGKLKRTVPTTPGVFAQEDYVNIPLELGPCVAPNTVVLRGKLIGLDTSDFPYLSLRARLPWPGPAHGASDFEPEFYAERFCEKEGDDGYRCETLGFRQTESHTLSVSHAGQHAEMHFNLPVNDCVAEVVNADIELPLKQPDRDAGQDSGR